MNWPRPTHSTQQITRELYNASSSSAQTVLYTAASTGHASARSAKTSLTVLTFSDRLIQWSAKTAWSLGSDARTIGVFHLHWTRWQTAYAHPIASRTILNVSNKHGKRSTPRLHRIGIVWSLAGGVPQRIAILVLVPCPFAPREQNTRPLSRSFPPQVDSKLYLGVAVRFAIHVWRLVTWVMLT